MNKQEKIREFLGTLNVENLDILYCIGNTEVESFDDIVYCIDNNRGFDVEIIYYSAAIKYLQENDTSLRESLGIASEYGYEVKNLNSEILASLLASQNCRNEFYELKDEIDNFFYHLED